MRTSTETIGTAVGTADDRVAPMLRPGRETHSDERRPPPAGHRGAPNPKPLAT